MCHVVTLLPVAAYGQGPQPEYEKYHLYIRWCKGSIRIQSIPPHQQVSETMV